MFLDEKNNFAVYHKADKKVIGSIGFKESWTDRDEQYSHLKAKEIGYVLAKDYWGQGLMTEGVKAVIGYFFKELELDAVSIAHFAENARSKRVIEKCGFKFIKQDIYHAKLLQKDFDDMKYLLVREPAFEIREVLEIDEKSHICNDILRSLPEWFGIEASIVDYVEQVRELPFYAVFDGVKPIGFVAIKIHSEFTAEVCVMGVLREYHRMGVGKRLINCCEEYCRLKHFEFLTVKTLSESAQSKSYDKTRQFYLSMGFRPLEVFPLLWDEHNPCLFMAKHLAVR
jgi:GNAT superfamily N-acetyltransferase